ncbi:ABC transporter ATP-binding protein [Rhodoligotrophos defluvii]|uniref:ABC transporter ATP-binding protein n=1 Tax=Rhodoligotrophos defluvii TaxID=2561934 RepID=UPI0010C99EA1|nr:ABC transporter ATP-binding protein [Rhodoligotrophos defluvii]
MSEQPLLKVDSLEVTYKKAIIAVQDVSFHVAEQQVVSILGANGAGKTSTLRAITGFIPLDRARVRRGAITFCGTSLLGLLPHQITSAGLVLVSERDKVFPNLSVSENIAAVGPSRWSASNRARREELAYTYFPRLAHLRRKEAGLLSGGERQMLAIAAAIVCGPRLLAIDELSLGLAPIVVQELAERLLEIRREIKLTLLLVEQSAGLAMRMADYVYVLENGRLAAQGTPKALAENADVQRIYLGANNGTRKSYRDCRAAGGVSSWS